MSLPNTTLTVRKFRHLPASKQNEVRFSAGTIEPPCESFIAFIRYSQTCNKRLFDLVRYLSKSKFNVGPLSVNLPPLLSKISFKVSTASPVGFHPISALWLAFWRGPIVLSKNILLTLKILLNNAAAFTNTIYFNCLPVIMNVFNARVFLIRKSCFAKLNKSTK